MKHALFSPVLPSRFSRPPTAALAALPLAALLLAGCGKDSVRALPKATQEGKNTAGCLLDDEAWTPEAAPSLYGNNDPVLAHWKRLPRGRGGNLYLLFSRSKKGEAKSAISFFLPELKQPSTFPLDQTANPALNSSNPPYANYILHVELIDRYFLTGPQAAGTLTITRFDTVACIASGTFEMTVRESSTGETHRLTHGRFDVRFSK